MTEKPILIRVYEKTKGRWRVIAVELVARGKEFDIRLPDRDAGANLAVSAEDLLAGKRESPRVRVRLPALRPSGNASEAEARTA